MRGYWVIVGLLVMSLNYIYAQSEFAYQQPDGDILALADARPAPVIRMKTDASKAVLLFRNSYKSIAELSEPEMKLAGIRVNPNTNGQSRGIYYTDVEVLDIQSGKTYQVTNKPNNPQLSNFSWNYAQDKMAFLHTTESGIELWVLDIESRVCKRLSGPIITTAVGSALLWSRDDKYIFTKTIPSNRKPLIDKQSNIPSGPIISENEGQKAQNRTYQDLLKGPIDEENFETLVTSEIRRYDLLGNHDTFLPAGMYTGMVFSPDGNYLLAYKLNKPFSYIVTYDRFPTDVDLYDKQGKFIKKLHTFPLTEELPKGFMAVRKGKRSIQWRADKPATLVWVEALDAGDPENDVPFRDAVYQLDFPYSGAGKLMVKTQDRYAGIDWGNDQTAVLYERWWNTRKSRILLFNPSITDENPRLFNERNSQDRYADPGDFVTQKNQFGLYTLALNEGKLLMIGDGYSEKGKFPFIDQYDLKTFDKKRIYESVETDRLEQLVTDIDTKKGLYLTRLESKNEYPNYYIRDIKKHTTKQITYNENPFKILNDVYKEVIKYKRKDGVELSATLYLPVGYDMRKKEKMPMVMWAYPTEYKDKASAGQVTANDNQFTFPYYGSPLYWLTKGYVVLDGASFPIIGEGDAEPNDSYVSQLVDNAKAAIDAVDQLGYIDPYRVAVGGHSYGAFMTANLLTHSDLFAAGIARSGAYNRTLTPFGFQSEERSYWEAPDVYNTMSPFQNADKMKTPLLLIHGEEDNNSGTYPMQSERYFNALKGLGATARLVILPKESHGYAARESILHMLWEQDQWLEKYVKNREK
ncbi:MAG: prolyl oligopeptidase family serine peptidase [Chitinophagales bacterium]|nr:prolyl oligopeptidase family serine peptidase [Chitinophagales bacterium]